MKVEIRKISDIKDYKEIPYIQKSAWGFSELDLEPHQLMTRVQKYGGLVMGLFVDGKIAGFSYAILAKWKGKLFLYSHMAAVKKEYQGRGFGYLIKKAQREEALKMGYDFIKWTFDPLESLNSYFNIHRLGAVGFEYELNIYGIGESGLHKGLPTDRMVAHWELNSERVKRRMGEKTPPVIIESSPPPPDFTSEKIYIEIPSNIRQLKKKNMEKALKWRYRTREEFLKAFEKGYVAVDIVFTKGRERVYYLLEKNYDYRK